MLLYISSAMTEYEHNNFDKFFEVEDLLKEKGYSIVNPAIISINMVNEKFFLNVDRKNFKDFYDYFIKISREEYLNEDIKELIKCDGIVMFGDWQKSKGATFELKVAMETGKKLYTLVDNELVELNNFGMKFDKKKVRMELVDMEFVKGVAEVLTFGAMKYSDDSWKYVDNAYSRYFGALLRHITELQFGKMIDEESGLNVIDHIACNVMFLRYFLKKEGKIK